MTDARAAALPRLCFVGPMVGRNKGCITHQGEIVADFFRSAGYSVTAVSSRRNRYHRLAEIVGTLLRRHRTTDLLVVQVYGEASFVVEDIASWIGARLNRPVVMVLHGGTLPTFMARFPSWSRRVLGRARVIVVPSEFLARALKPYGLDVRVIPNALDLSAYPYRRRATVRPKLFWMRAFYEHYHPMLAVRVLEHIRAEMPDASLVMGGPDMGLQASVRQYVEDHGMRDAVHFAGFLDMAGKVREGSAADIFLNTNRIDNMPVAVLEACAMGLPVVSTNVGGIPDLLTHDENALLVPSDDVGAMTGAVRRLCEQPGLAERLSANGRRLAERCALPCVQPLWERVFADALGADCIRSSRLTVDAIRD